MQDDTLVAYQIAFDLYDGATQHFLRRVQDCLRPLLPAEGDDKSEGEGERWVGRGGRGRGGWGRWVGRGGRGHHTQVNRAGLADTPLTCRAEAMETDDSGESQETSKEEVGLDTSPPAEPETQSETKTQSESTTVEPEVEAEPEPEWVQKLRSVIGVLGGECTVALRQDFLIRNNHTDLLVLKNMKVRGSHSCGHTPSCLWPHPLLACGHTPSCLCPHPSPGCESKLHLAQWCGGGQRVHALRDDC